MKEARRCISDLISSLLPNRRAFDEVMQGDGFVPSAEGLDQRIAKAFRGAGTWSSAEIQAARELFQRMDQKATARLAYLDVARDHQALIHEHIFPAKHRLSQAELTYRDALANAAQRWSESFVGEMTARAQQHEATGQQAISDLKEHLRTRPGSLARIFQTQAAVAWAEKRDSLKALIRDTKVAVREARAEAKSRQRWLKSPEGRAASERGGSQTASEALKAVEVAKVELLQLLEAERPYRETLRAYREAQANLAVAELNPKLPRAVRREVLRAPAAHTDDRHDWLERRQTWGSKPAPADAIAAKRKAPDEEPHPLLRILDKEANEARLSKRAEPQMEMAPAR